jgi:hypothetical protein
MATMSWKSLDSFQRDLPGADESRLKAMRDWAAECEARSDAPGMGRNPKARRMFRQMRGAAEELLADRYNCGA